MPVASPLTCVPHPAIHGLQPLPPIRGQVATPVPRERGLRLTRGRHVPPAGAAQGVAAPQIKPRFNLPGSPNETGPRIFLFCARTLKPGTRDSSPFPPTLARLIPCRDATETIEFRRWRGERSWAVLRRPRRCGCRRPSYRWLAGGSIRGGGRCRLAQQVNGGRASRWSMAGLPISGVCEFVRIFPFQAISPDPSCTFSCVKTRLDPS